MVPSNTFTNCGSLSMLDCRRNLPILVIRGSLVILKAAPSASFWASREACNSSELRTMVLNLNILKRLLLSPILS